MEEEDFEAGDLSIQYLEDHPNLMEGEEDDELLRAAAAAAAILQEGERNRVRMALPPSGASSGFSPWKRAGWPFSGR
jgi:hypothetical protein